MSHSESFGRAGGGMDTTRTPVDPAAERVRAAAAANARGNLAAIILDRHGISPDANTADLDDAVKAELVELAQALGLDGAHRRPGYCVCGSALTVTASSQQTGEYLPGHCLPCSRAGREAGHG